MAVLQCCPGAAPPDNATVPAPPLPVPSSCLGTSNPHGTVLSDAASALLARLSVVAPALAHVETALEDKPALRSTRLRGLFRRMRVPARQDMFASARQK